MPPLQMPELVTALLSSGLFGIGAIAFVEKLVPAVPSYVLYVFFGMTIVSDDTTLALVILATSIGSTFGALCWYAVGRALGPRRTEALVTRFGHYVRLDIGRYRRLAAAYRLHPFRVSLIGQITPVVRLYAPLPAGMLGLRSSTFLAATALGGVIWNGLLLGFGYALRHRAYDPVHVGVAVIAGLIVLELGALLALRIRWGLTPTR